MSDNPLLDRMLQLREGWSQLGHEITELAKQLGLDVCSRCNGYIPEGKHHAMFNGNQMFACVEKDGPEPDYARLLVQSALDAAAYHSNRDDREYPGYILVTKDQLLKFAEDWRSLGFTLGQEV